MDTVLDTAIGTTTPETAPVELSHAEQVLTRENLSDAEKVTAFRKARHEERMGTAPAAKEVKEKEVVAEKAKPIIEAKSKTDDDEPAEEGNRPGEKARTLSRRQQDINDSIRSAVEPLHAEIKRLQSQLNPDGANPKPRAAVEDLEPDPANTEKYPDGQFDRSYLKDIAAWQTRQTLKEHDTRQSAGRQHDSAVQAVVARGKEHRQKFDAAFQADPTLKDKIDPSLGQLHPSVDLLPGQEQTFGHVIADWLYETDHPVALAVYLSDKAEQHRLASLPPLQFIREQGRIEDTLARQAKPKAEVEKVEKPAPKKLTTAPEPVTELGQRPTEASDPIEAAFQGGNYTAYSAAKKAKGVQHWSG